jgi:hypothetical protein
MEVLECIIQVEISRILNFRSQSGNKSWKSGFSEAGNKENKYLF